VQVCTLLVTHRLASCVQADEILVLADGRICERGSHAELLHKAGGEYARMWKTQTEDTELGREWQ